VTAICINNEKCGGKDKSQRRVDGGSYFNGLRGGRRSTGEGRTGDAETVLDNAFGCYGGQRSSGRGSSLVMEKEDQCIINRLRLDSETEKVRGEAKSHPE